MPIPTQGGDGHHRDGDTDRGADLAGAAGGRTSTGPLPPFEMVSTFPTCAAWSRDAPRPILLHAAFDRVPFAVEIYAADADSALGTLDIRAPNR